MKGKPAYAIDLRLDTADKARWECEYYLFRGKCANADAPKPNQSRCIGTKRCENWKYKS